MARSPLAQFVLTAVVGVLAATLISWQGDGIPVTSAVGGGSIEAMGANLLLRAEFTGVDEDGLSLRWHAAAEGEWPAISVWIRPLVAAEQAADRRWPVAGHLEAEPGTARALSADLAGSIDWERGLLRLDGGGTGLAAGDHVRVDARIIDLDLHGVVHIERPGPIALQALLR